MFGKNERSVREFVKIKWLLGKEGSLEGRTRV